MAKTSCLINNYNYCKFVIEAIESALLQSIQFDEIIVVDDLSTDDSVKVIKEKYKDNPLVTIIPKMQNEGQLSTFNKGFSRSSGDIICFLDADDIYPPEYLRILLEVYEQHPQCGCVYSTRRTFKNADSLSLPDEKKHSSIAYHTVQIDGDLVKTYYLQTFYHAPTSAISFRRQSLDLILPVPYIEDWRIRADDCLTCGAALAGIQRLKLRGYPIHYRVHSSNNFAQERLNIAQKKYNYDKEYKRKIALNRFIKLMCKRQGYDPNRFYEVAVDEFRAINRPSWQNFWLYLAIAFWSKTHLPKKVKSIFRIMQHMLCKAVVEKLFS